MSIQVVPVKPINPLLARYLQSLALRPVLTKSCTNATISFISETLAGVLSGHPPLPLSAKERTGIPPLDLILRYQKSFKLSAYGFFISAPLSHLLLTLLQKAFAGKDSARAKIAMIVASNVLISPIQNSVYIIAMALINGAHSPASVLAAWKASFIPIMRLTTVISTLSMATAQKFLAPELWVPFFNLIAGVAGTYINVQTKKKMALQAQLKAAAAAKDDEKK